MNNNEQLPAISVFVSLPNVKLAFEGKMLIPTEKRN